MLNILSHDQSTLPVVVNVTSQWREHRNLEAPVTLAYVWLIKLLNVALVVMQLYNLGIMQKLV